MRLAAFACALSLALAVPAWAQSAAVSAPQPAQATELQAVTVSGVQPGPGLWKVSKGGHVMWVLGVLRPLPERMQWQSAEVEQAIARSQEVIGLPQLKFKLDTGFLGKLFLLPTALGARKNDDGKTLQDLVPAPDYARWQALKQQYIGGDRGIERWRPIFAAMELYKKALRRNGLRNATPVDEVVQALARQHGVRQTQATYLLEIKQPRAAIKAFKSSGVDDLACFDRTLDAVEHDIPAMAERANAWATGDLETLRRLPDSDRRDTCVNALTEAGFAHQLGIDDVPQRIENTWLDAARAALANNAQTFALLPMDEVLDAGGYLGRLKAEGYTVASPEQQDEDDAPAAAGSAATPPAATSTPARAATTAGH
jgi:uncharacterized protein YbaP (TraB family)